MVLNCVFVEFAWFALTSWFMQLVQLVQFVQKPVLQKTIMHCKNSSSV